MAYNNRSTNNTGGLTAQSDSTGKQEYLLSHGGSLDVNITGGAPDTTASGSITAVSQTVTIATNGQSTVGIQVTGSFTGTLLVEGTTDGSTWSPTTAIALSNGTIQASITGPFNGQSNVGGLSSLRLRATAFSAGTATVTLRASVAVSTIMLDNPLPTGTNSIGTVVPSGGDLTSANQKTQIVSSGGVVVGVDANNNLDTTLGTKLDSVNDSITNYKLGHSYTNITTNTTTTVKSGAGVLVGITLNNPALLTVANLTLTIYDNTAGSGTKVGTLTIPFGLTSALPFKIPYELAFSTGLTIVTAGPTVTADITVEWR